MKTLGAEHTLTPRVITVDKNPAYPKALTELKEAGMLPTQSELRQIKYLNNLVEQDHRFIKDSSNRGSASSPLRRRGEPCKDTRVMHMIRKGQIKGVEKGDARGQVLFIANLFGVAA
jgi:IS6 family transposase